MDATHLQDLGSALYLYLLEHPQALLIAIGATLYIGVAIVWGILDGFAPFDRAKRAFRRVGVRPSQEQEQALSDDFAAIGAEHARQALHERLQHEDALKQEQIQLEHIAHLSEAHVELVKKIGAILQSLESEYLKGEASLTSAQAKEALRVTVDQAVRQITALTASSSTAPPTDLPTFNLHQNSEAADEAADGSHSSPLTPLATVLSAKDQNGCLSPADGQK